jgi:hypothetical protein
MEVRVFGLHTAEMKAYEVTASVSGVEIFRIWFGCSLRDLAREASKLLTQRIGWLCWRR